MKAPVKGWKAVEVEDEVFIPDSEGKVKYTVKVPVPAWKDSDGEIYFDQRARYVRDRIKARHMGLLSPEEIAELRECLGLTQKQLCELLQIGEKSWSRWENGRERPSKVINVLLRALQDGRIDPCYLQHLNDVDESRRFIWTPEDIPQQVTPYSFDTLTTKGKSNETKVVAA